MVRHQIVIASALASQFPEARPFQEPEDLSWFLVELDGGWVVINSDYGYIELVRESALGPRQAEEVIFRIVRTLCPAKDLEQHIGLSPEHVSWVKLKRLPSFVRERYEEIKRLVDEAGSLDKAWFHIMQLNQVNILGLEDDWGPEEWLRWALEKELPEVSPSYWVRLWNTLFRRRPWERKSVR